MAKSPGIFIVDPDPDTRYQIAQMVPETGFTVSGQAGLGTEAVASVTEAAPEIILCAMKEPVSRVVQTIESISYALPDTPIIVYSDTTDLDIIRKAILAGARNFLSSPIRLDELKRSLSATLEAEERRHVRSAGNSILGPQGAIITVFGAKGGVGKTTVAGNLAVALVRQAGQSCVLVDADDSFGDAAANLAVTSERTLIDALRASDDDDGDLKSCLAYHESGLAIVSAPTDPLEWRDVGPEQVEKMLHRLARHFDVVLVDTSGTLGDVSQAALRHWADGGHLRVYRTPGGHRRFLREDVMAFTDSGATPPDASNSDALEGSALRRIRRRLHQESVSSQSWHSSMDSEGRFRMRLFGRRLLSLLAQETPPGHRRQEALDEAYQLGRQYGSEMAEKSVSLKDTVEAFIFFRKMVLESADSNAWTRILELADRVLVGVTESYEDRLSRPAATEQGAEAAN